VNFTATSTAAHSATLSWTGSTSVVAGYNVYRGTTTGGPYTLVNPSLVSLLTYVDLSVQAGQTYFYVTTAVDGSGNESVNSNEVQAVIP
jgi:fibronectin type 3 domain-containing protein